MTSTTIDRVRALVEPVVVDLGLEIYDLEQRGGTLRVTIDTPTGSESGVSLDTIAVVTRLLSRELDHEDPIPGKYTLEVTSPGVERALRTPHHFTREVGKRITVRLSDSSVEQRRVEGLLSSCDGQSIVLDTESRAMTIAISAIDKAKTIFEWGPAPKPGGPRSKKSRQSGITTPNPAESYDSGTDAEEQP